MYKKVLVTLDGSELSEAVLPQVERLVAGTDAQVTLLRAMALPTASGERVVESVLEVAGSPSVRLGLGQPSLMGEPALKDGETLDQAMERIEHEMEAYLEERAQRLRAKGVKVETVVQFGDDPAGTILDYARSQDFDLIMMASHGRTGLARLVLGSVAGRILKSGVKPVLVVRPDKLEE